MITPSGCITVKDAIERIGRQMFGAKWTNLEFEARSGLVTVEKWEHDWNTPAPVNGGSGARQKHFPSVAVDPVKLTEEEIFSDPRRYPFGNPRSPDYQAERLARIRRDDAFKELHRRLEAKELDGVVVDYWSGAKAIISDSVWRRSNADKMIEKEQAPQRHSSNPGRLFIRDVGWNDKTIAPLPRGASANRKRGPKVSVKERVKKKMREFGDIEALRTMKEIAMEAEFGASRNTCRKVRNEILSEFVADENSDN